MAAAQPGQRNEEGVSTMDTIDEQAARLQQEWATGPRWAGITRDYSAADVIRLRGGAAEGHGPARLGARRLWDLLHRQDAVRALGAVSGDDPVLVVRAGPPAPVVAEAEVGFGGALDAFDFMTAVIEAGAAGVRFEDQLPSGPTRGPGDEKVLIPTAQHIETLTAARLAADVLDVPALVIARTAAHEAALLSCASDERDHEFLTGERTADGLHRVAPGLYACVTRGLAFAPYADLLWLETPAPSLAEARAFARVIHSQYPEKLLAYSCAPSFDWRAELDDASIARFQRELAALGYRFQLTAPLASVAEVPALA